MITAAVIAGLTQLLPSLVHMFAGDKAGVVADKVAGIAQSITGAKTPEEALANLQADQKLAAEFKAKVLDQYADLEKAYLGDRSDARARDVELHKAGFKNERANFMVALAFACLLGMIAALWMSAMKKLEIPGEILAIFNMAIGMVLKMLSDAFQFEFGSSRGSAEKTKLMGLLGGKQS